MKKHIRAFVSLLCAAALALGCASCGGAAQSIGKSGGTAGVTHITVWTYYNGDQLESFNKLVDQFNETTGREKGIRVESASQGSMSDLETNVMDAAQGKVGAAAMPNIFSAYADTAYALDQMGMLVDLSQYLTEDERAQYVQGYLDEGDFDGDGSMKIFPVAKSTELMFLNETDWEKFARATGAAYDDLSTVEGLVATAGAYYDWTDAQTPEPDDGKALFGRDAMANYMLVEARQLGDTLFEVQDGKMTLNFDKDVARKLWDNYYVPFVKGWFAAIGRFRSDDIKVGNVLAYVGSNSSATFFPTQVMVNDTESYDIDMTVLPSPKFAGGEDVAVQQGAGMVVTAGTEEEINASVEFLKWFTQPETQHLLLGGLRLPAGDHGCQRHGGHQDQRPGTEPEDGAHPLECSPERKEQHPLYAKCLCGRQQGPQGAGIQPERFCLCRPCNGAGAGGRRPARCRRGSGVPHRRIL